MLPKTSRNTTVGGGKRRVVSKSVVRFAAGGYMVCSSFMLIANKLAVHNLPAPQFVLFSQLFASALFCFIFGALNLIKVDKLESNNIKMYLPAVVAFLGTIFCNIKTLQYCNVETFIVFRASTPIVVSIGDYLFLGRELPSYRSLLCLLGLVGGVGLYTYTDQGFEIRGYRWLAAWYIMFLIDQLYLKHVVKKVQHKSNWGRVYYLNLLSAMPLFVAFIWNQELAEEGVEWTMASIAALLFSCILGVAMSYFAFLARHAVSATSFTVLGNVCKVITVVINLLIWDKHANLPGFCALFICLVCAYYYKQAPLRKGISH